MPAEETSATIVLTGAAAARNPEWPSSNTGRRELRGNVVVLAESHYLQMLELLQEARGRSMTRRKSFLRAPCTSSLVTVMKDKPLLR